MIFVTVGSDVPFDRLIRAVDTWARESGRRDVFAQIGRGGWVPEYIPYAPMLQPSEFKERLVESSIVVGHAGMGTILSALQQSRPVLVMPRRGKLGETRNDHQMATARHLSSMEGIEIAFDEEDLHACLNRLGEARQLNPISEFASSRLVGKVRGFIHNKQL